MSTAQVFSDVILRGRKFPRITNYLNKLAKTFSDVSYTESDSIIRIPSIDIEIAMSECFPFSSPIISTGGTRYVMPNYRPCFKLGDLLPTFLKHRDTEFVVYPASVEKNPLTLRRIYFITNGVLTEFPDVKIAPDTTIDEFVDYLKIYYDPAINDIYKINVVNSRAIYSALHPYANKQMHDLVHDGCSINVTLHYRLCEQRLVDLMKKSVTLNLSASKIVSTPNSGQCPGIIRFHLELYKDNLDTILEHVFNMKGVCVKYGSNVNLVVFYLDTHLNIFTAELKNTIPEFRDVEDLPDMLLTKLSDILTIKDEPYYSIMLALFGNISGDAPAPIIPTGYVPDERVMKAYRVYESICSV